jgi:hypothetical protein
MADGQLRRRKFSWKSSMGNEQPAPTPPAHHTPHIQKVQKAWPPDPFHVNTTPMLRCVGST